MKRVAVLAIAASLFCLSLPGRANQEPKRPPRILLRSSWQIVNIGDIAHTPGILALIEKHIPGADVILWASGDLTPEVAAIEHKRFPKLRVVKGAVTPDGQTKVKELAEAMDWCDFLLHGSGASFVAAKDVGAFVKRTGKPFGVYGITYGGADAGPRELLSKAKFVFFRDTVSLMKAKMDGIRAPIMAFAPDAAFACDLRNDEAATRFLADNHLEEGKFVCVIPRLRYTPYWKIRNKEKTDLDRKKHERNEAMKEHDHEPLRRAIIAVVREAKMKVLLCPEDQSQMQVGKELVYDKLPDDVKRQVVWREKYWLTDEALSVYVKSAGLFGLEMHSPIMCIGNGVWAIVCRFMEQTTKGLMWRDIGLGDWLFDFDEEQDLERLTPTVLSVLRDPSGTRARVARARASVEDRQRESMAVLRRCLEEK